MNKQRSAYSVKDGDKAFDLLDILATEDSDITALHLAKKLKLSNIVTLRLIMALESRQLVEYDATSGICRLGLSAFRMSQSILNSNSLLRLAHPVMEELARELDEAIYLTVMKDDEVLFLDMVDSVQQIRTAPLVGHRFPFFTNAAGKAIKAMSASDLFSGYGKKRLKKKDIKDVEQLEQELIDIRRRGVAIEAGGLGQDICTVAVAVRDYAGKVVGALTMLAPSFRIVQERLEQEIIPAMQYGAELLSLRFGYSKVVA